jgi:hypoxanthine-DNA glycosylase
LRKNGVALWDAAHTCFRKGSLDSNMTEAAANNFAALFATAPQIHTVFFNGQTAAALFRKLVLPELKRELELIILPSTSPANASIPPAKKKAAWRKVQAALK